MHGSGIFRYSRAGIFSPCGRKSLLEPMDSLVWKALVWRSISTVARVYMNEGKIAGLSFHARKSAIPIKLIELELVF